MASTFEADTSMPVTRIPLEAASGWQIDPERVRAAIRPDTRYMVLNEPYNPAGTLMSHELQAELTSIAEEHGIVILSDRVVPVRHL